MSFGPLPSQLCLLDSLPSKAVGDKVRFLGCVSSYSVTSGVLELEHRSSVDANVSALVDVHLVLEKLGAEQTRSGEWLNVIGYITAITSSKIRVQALLVWSAGPLDIQQYQFAIQHSLMDR